MSNDQSWRFERHITFGLVVALALQTAGALIWAGATGERLRYLESRAEAASPVNERLARLEEQTGQMRASLERIERRLHDQEIDQ
ncbi:MAG: hypothetical protein AAFX09_00105 [Pseudomonadota bacterium]